jgi:hypothetical protein
LEAFAIGNSHMRSLVECILEGEEGLRDGRRERLVGYIFGRRMSVWKGGEIIRNKMEKKKRRNNYSNLVLRAFHWSCRGVSISGKQTKPQKS